MKLLLFTVLLTIVQTSSPVPRQAPDNRANQSDSVTKDSKDDKAPTDKSVPATAPIQQPPGSNHRENTGREQKTQNTQQPITIRELPPVSVSRDWADWVLLVSTVLLVLAGFIGIGFAYKTLKNIEEQTVTTRKAADAAKESADVARDTLHLTQAADVHIEEIKLVPNGVLSGDTVIYIVVKNHGQARAEQFVEELSLGIKGRGPALPKRGMSLVIGAGQIFSVAFAPLRSGISTEDLAMILGGQLSLKICGLLKYKDIFRKSYVIDCECTYSPTVGNFLIDRYEHRRQEETQAN
jgi:hypothetical protein